MSLSGSSLPHRAAWPALRWERRELLHVTVAFLGEIDERGVQRLLPRLERVAGRCPPLTLSFAGAGAFPGGGAYARVLWTGLYGDRRTLAGLVSSVGAAGRQVGVVMGRAQDLPAPSHAGSVPPAHGCTASGGGVVHLRRAPWNIRELHLMRSHQDSRPRYERPRNEAVRDGTLRDEILLYETPRDETPHDGDLRYEIIRSWPLYRPPGPAAGGHGPTDTADDSRLPGP
jgi:2''-5'' RNA ligase